eukprot:m.128729 g.128729  ORF g.128729 m.128729 type:complete len:377 (+) comp29352_c0_seq1:366-1496(+)
MSSIQATGPIHGADSFKFKSHTQQEVKSTKNALEVLFAGLRLVGRELRGQTYCLPVIMQPWFRLDTYDWVEAKFKIAGTNGVYLGVCDQLDLDSHRYVLGNASCSVYFVGNRSTHSKGVWSYVRQSGIDKLPQDGGYVWLKIRGDGKLGIKFNISDEYEYVLSNINCNHISFVVATHANCAAVKLVEIAKGKNFKRVLVKTMAGDTYTLDDFMPTTPEVDLVKEFSKMYPDIVEDPEEIELMPQESLELSHLQSDHNLTTAVGFRRWLRLERTGSPTLMLFWHPEINVTVIVEDPEADSFVEVHQTKLTMTDDSNVGYARRKISKLFGVEPDVLHLEVVGHSINLELTDQTLLSEIGVRDGCTINISYLPGTWCVF